jgi:hypothetical protein
LVRGILNLAFILVSALVCVVILALVVIVVIVVIIALVVIVMVAAGLLRVSEGRTHGSFPLIVASAVFNFYFHGRERLEEELRDVRERGRVAGRDTIVGEKREELAEDVVDVARGFEIARERDQFLAHTIDGEELLLLPCVRNAQGAMCFRAGHAAAASVGEGELALLGRGRQRFGGTGRDRFCEFFHGCLARECRRS